MSATRPAQPRGTDAAPDEVWGALADPTRRAILDLLREGPKTTGAIADAFPVTRFAVMKHLTVLEASGLVVVRRSGRERWNHLNVVPLQQIYERWMSPYRSLWASRLTRFKTALEGEPMPTAAAAFERVELEIRIAARRARVWRALTEETTLWWPRDFYTGPGRGFHIEPRLGGRVYEDWGNDTGVIWYHVFAINPNTSIDLQGAMGVPYGPALSLLHLELAEDGGQTVLKVSDAVLGGSGDCDGTKEAGWRQVFDAGLRAYVERANR